MFKNIISEMDTSSYLKLLNELKIYLREYFLKYKGVECSSFSIIGISYFDLTQPIYKIQIDLFDYIEPDTNKKHDISGNLNMSLEEFEIFLRIIKIKKIKNEMHIKYNKKIK